jgi:hypothetical protein
MAGKIRRIIDQIIKERGGGNPTLVTLTRTKLILKGFNPDKYTSLSEDDPAVLAKVTALAQELGVRT